ncbi:MAG: YcgL domain-containing protein [Rhodanobacter sp.]
MHCFVYASLRKADAYLWLARRDHFEVLPESLALMLGELRFALEVELSGQRRLPFEDAQQVIEHLRTQGWHLQLPPQQTLAAANHLPYNSAPTDQRNTDRRDDADQRDE